MSDYADLAVYDIPQIEIRYYGQNSDMRKMKINSPDHAFEIFRSNWDDGKITHIEEAKALFLNRANFVIGIFILSIGGVAGTIFDPKVLFQAALAANASSMLIAHNHPSQNCNPSQHDIDLTHRLQSIGKLMELPVLDHLIISDTSYCSLANEGILEPSVS